MPNYSAKFFGQVIIWKKMTKLWFNWGNNLNKDKLKHYKDTDFKGSFN